MPTMEQTARDAQAFAESLARAAKDNPELRAKLKSMMGGPLNAQERVEDLVLDLMRGNAGPAPPIAAMVAVLLMVAARLVYMDMGAQRGKTRDTLNSLLDPLTDRIESEFEASGLNGVIQKLDDAKRRGDRVEYDRLKRQIDDEVANMEGKMADGSDH